MKYIHFLILVCLHVMGNSSPFKKAETVEDLNQQFSFLEKNGYLWIQNFFNEKQTKLLPKWADSIHEKAQMQLANEDFTGALVVVPEASDSSIVCRTEDHSSSDRMFEDWIEPKIQKYICSLSKEQYVLFKDKLNFKWPGGGAFPPHQDFPAYELFRPRFHLNAMVCIDKATLENGCLQVAKNWTEIANHPNEVLPFIKGGKNHGMIKREILEKCEWLTLETSPGDVVIFTSFIPHFSEGNHSRQSRRGLFLTYNRLSEGLHHHEYYRLKREDPQNPVFHIGTPTNARTK